MRESVFLLLLLMTVMMAKAQISVHDGSGNNPDNSAMLDVQSADKGVLVPNVSITDLSTEAPVTAPADGLLVYNTNVGTGVGYHYWDDTAGEWVRLITSANTLHTGTGIADKVAFWTTGTNLSANNNFHWNDGAGRLGIGTPSPSDNLEVAGGNVFISDNAGMLKLKGVEGTTYELRPSQNATTGVAIRSQSNPAAGENLFLVEPSGGSTRFGVTQSHGVWSPDGYWVGSYNTGIGSVINTGMFSPASNQLALSSDGSERIRIASNGNVGIGTTLPWQKLDVVGTTYLRAAPTHSQDTEQLRFGRTDLDVRYHSIHTNHTGNAATNYMRFRIHDNNGTLGQTDVLTLLGDGNVQLNNYADGLVKTTGGNGTLAIATGTDLPSGSNDYIQNQTTTDQAAGFRINGNGLFNGGNVGISNTSPQALLHIGTGNNSLRAGFWTNANADIDALIPGSTFGGLIQGGDNGHITIGIRDNDANDGFNVVSGSGNFMSDDTYDRLVLHANTMGNVGIGTASPARALHVLDDARVDGNDGIEVRRGLHGGYGISSPSSGNWGANIWTIGPSWQGTGYGTTYALSGSHYGISWLRNSHPSTDAISREGLHIYRASTLAAAIGYNGAHFTNRVVIDGNVGIGVNNPTYELHVNGRIRTNAINETSDSRLKKDISGLSGALSKILAMRGVNYRWRTDEFPHMELDSTLQFGLIAQELEKVIPELVHTDAEGWKSIEYSHIVPVLIEAMKEQQEIIGQYWDTVQKQQLELDELRTMVTEIVNGNQRTDRAALAE